MLPVQHQHRHHRHYQELLQQKQQQQQQQLQLQQQQQQYESQQGPSATAGIIRKRKTAPLSAANSRRSVAISDAILAAQAAFAGGEFQPEAFPRCVCSLLEAFEGGDNAVRLCTARLLERYRPYLGSNVIAVEVAQRVSRLLGNDDPTTREICLDVLAAVAFAVGGLPRSILHKVDRSLRSPFLAERLAAARAYASSISIERSLLSSSSSSAGDGDGDGGSVWRFSAEPSPLAIRTPEKLAALCAALMPMLSEESDDIVCMPRENSLVATASRWSAEVEELLKAVLSKVDGGLPSTEAWESLKGFLLDEDRTNDAGKLTWTVCSKRRAAADVIISRLRISSKSAVEARAAGWTGDREGRSLPLLRVIAVDFIVSLVRLEAASVVEHGEQQHATVGCRRSTSGKASSAVASAGVESVWRLLDALMKPTDDHEETAELLSVLGAPALADAVLDSEFALGGAGGRVPGAPPHRDGGRGDENGIIDSSVRNRFPLTSAAVKRLRDLSRLHLPSSSPRAPASARISEAVASGLVSYAAAAFRRCSSYREGDSSSGDARGKALSTLARHAADGALRSPPVLRLLSDGGSHGVDGGGGEGSGVKNIFPQLRALAIVHSWPRRRLALVVAQRLAALAPNSPLAVDVAVLSSHIVGAGIEGGGDVDAAKSTRGAVVNTVERLLCDLLLSRRFAENPKAAVGIAVALMRLHRGTLARQTTLSTALVEAMGPRDGGTDGDKTGGQTEPLVCDSWFQLVLCKECMLHGFYGAAEAGLRQLRGGRAEFEKSDFVTVWTEVLAKVSAAEAHYAGTADQVAAHACAHHVTLQAAELLASLPRSASLRCAPVRGRLACGGGEGQISGVFRGDRDEFSYQRSFLEARAELLQLLGASWGMCQELSAARNSRYARYTRREGRCRRLPAAYRRLARDFRLLRGLRPGAGPTTSEPLRAAACLCLLLAVSADALLSQGKSAFTAPRENKGATKKRSWRAWLERVASGGSDCDDEGDESEGGGGEGPLMKAVRVLASRLGDLGNAPSAPVGRAAFTSILESVRSVPFPIPRAFFRTGGEPRVALSLLPPPPTALTQGLTETTNSGWTAGQSTHPQQPQQRERASSPAPPSNDGENNSNSGGGGDAGSRRSKRDGGASARYYGPSCGLRVDITAGERSRRPPLPLMSPVPEAGNSASASGGKHRHVSLSPLFSSVERWWAQAAREEALVGGGEGGNGWRAQAQAQAANPGMWLLQGSVCRGRGAGGALPPVSKVILDVSALIPAAADGFRDIEASGTQPGVFSQAPKMWSKKIIAETFGALVDASTALCFRARIAVPPLPRAHRRVEVTVSLRRRGGNERTSGTGLVALDGGYGGGGGVGGGGGDEEPELWVIGSVSVPLC